MEKAVIRKKAEISDLLKEYKELINLQSGKVSEYLKMSIIFQILKKHLMIKMKITFKT